MAKGRRYRGARRQHPSGSANTTQFSWTHVTKGSQATSEGPGRHPGSGKTRPALRAHIPDRATHSTIAQGACPCPNADRGHGLRVHQARCLRTSPHADGVSLLSLLEHSSPTSSSQHGCPISLPQSVVPKITGSTGLCSFWRF